MALVNVTNIVVNDNPALFTRGFKFQVTFECIAPLTDGACCCAGACCRCARAAAGCRRWRRRPRSARAAGAPPAAAASRHPLRSRHLARRRADLEWKVIYVGSASGPQYDQELENVLVGPVPLGTSTFVLTAPAPTPSLIPEEDVLGATVVLVCCSYKGHEFIRVGYWVNNTYGEALPEGAWAAGAALCRAAARGRLCARARARSYRRTRRGLAMRPCLPPQARSCRTRCSLTRLSEAFLPTGRA